LKTKGSPSKEVTGKYVVIWEKVGKDWKLATDIWNEGK
jgi:ketosteroid isomerase-like protein